MELSENKDLSEKLGPMTVKELRQSLRRSSFVYPFIFIHIFATLAIYAEFQLPEFGNASKAAVFIWDPAHTAPFWWVAISICGILMPMAGFFLMPHETEEGNHELLLLTPLSRWQVVSGKFFMLWGLCILTFTSLLPYIVARYFIGGIEWGQEVASAGTVISLAALISAGAIAASGFSHIAGKIGVFTLFIFSTISGGGLGMIGGGIVLAMAETSKYGILCSLFYHFNALCVVLCYCILGLLIARSRMRLAIMAFELKPSSLLLITLGLSPFIVGMVAACTCGFGSVVGVILLAFISWHSDVTPKAPKWMPPPRPNIPPPPSR